MYAITYTNQEWHRTVKNIGGEKTLANYSILSSFFANFHNFHNIPYAHGLQFAKVFYCTVYNLLSQINNHYFHVHDH